MEILLIIECGSRVYKVYTGQDDNQLQQQAHEHTHHYGHAPKSDGTGAATLPAWCALPWATLDHSSHQMCCTNTTLQWTRALQKKPVAAAASNGVTLRHTCWEVQLWLKTCGAAGKSSNTAGHSLTYTGKSVLCTICSDTLQRHTRIHIMYVLYYVCSDTLRRHTRIHNSSSRSRTVASSSLVAEGTNNHNHPQTQLPGSCNRASMQKKKQGKHAKTLNCIRCTKQGSHVLGQYTTSLGVSARSDTHQGRGAAVLHPDEMLSRAPYSSRPAGTDERYAAAVLTQICPVQYTRCPRCEYTAKISKTAYVYVNEQLLQCPCRLTQAMHMHGTPGPGLGRVSHTPTRATHALIAWCLPTQLLCQA